MKSKGTLIPILAVFAVVGIASGGIPAAEARPARYTEAQEPSRIPGTPVLAVVGLKEQRVSIYDAGGKIMESPVSTGQTGLETPAGIYSVVQKEEEHHSNVYDDASMPFMERITWTGIALHAGVLPGYPASHGCVRMPESFAEELYQITQLGMRVVIVREDIAPANIAQPAIFKPKPRAQDSDGTLRDDGSSAMPIANTLRDPDLSPSITSQMGQLRLIAASKAAEAEAAKRREREARQIAAKKSADAAPAVKALRAAEANAAKAEADLKAVSERVLEANASPEQIAQAEGAKVQAKAKVEAARAQLETAKGQAQVKTDAAAKAQDDAKTAAAEMNLAVDAAEKAEQNTSPVSVFISRKMQRLFIRKGNQPVFESAVTILDPDKPIGTFIYTAVDYANRSGDMRWTVVSMYKDPAYEAPAPVAAPAQKGRSKAIAKPTPEAAAADVAGAQAALNRLVIPQEAADRISEVVLPGSSLIVSDEGLSIETGKDTDFVVVMSGEPQGGIAIRHHPKPDRGGRDEYAETPWGSSRGRRSGGGFPFFFSDD